MKKIIGLSIAALLIIGLVGGGTYAAFSDTQTSQNNTLMAGTLYFANGGTQSAFLTLTGLKPGSSNNSGGTGYYTTLQNSGNLSASSLTVATASITHSAGAAVGDITPKDSLVDETQIAFYMATGGNHSFTTGDTGLKYDGTNYTGSGTSALQYFPLAAYFADPTQAGTGTAATLGTVTTSGSSPNKVITGIPVSTGGTNYTVPPAVIITDATGSGAVAYATISGGAVTSITVVSGGSGYTSPTVSLAGGTTTGKSWSIGALAAGATDAFSVAYQIPSACGNEIQGGSAGSNFVFTVTQ